MRNIVLSLKGLAAALVLAVAGMAPAQAAYISTTEGNDCSGVLGTFPNCVVAADPANGIPNDTPIIIKINFNDNGSFGQIEINPLYSSIDGTEFTFDFGQDGTGTGTWTYTPGTGDPAITAFIAKGGNAFNLFSTLGDYTDVAYYTPNNASGGPAGLSHMSFYNSGDDFQVPEPGTMALLGLGLLGIGLARRRKAG
jgi:hypothetical protein